MPYEESEEFIPWHKLPFGDPMPLWLGCCSECKGFGRDSIMLTPCKSCNTPPDETW